MKNKILLLGALLAICFASNIAMAQEEMDAQSEVTVLATINISEASIVSQDDNKFKLSFVISNQEGIQPSIKYSVRLVNKETGMIADEKIYENEISLAENEAIRKKMEYLAPEYLSGTYEIWIHSKNDKGLPLGQGLAGEVILEGTGEYIEIVEDSCYLQIEGEENQTKYTLAYGVDIEQEENLVGVCDVKSNFRDAQDITANFDVHFRTVYGDIVFQQKENPIQLESSEKKQLKFQIPKVEKPQAYDAVLRFENENGEKISNAVAFHYVLSGSSATIQNVRLDKSYYAKGETAQVTFNWTGSADNFEGSRLGASLLEKAVVEIGIKDFQKMACAAPFRKELKESSHIENINLRVAMNRECVDPTVSVWLKDKNGNILDQSEFTMLGKQELKTKTIPSQQKDSKSFSRAIWAAIIMIIIILLSTFLLFLFKKRNVNNSVRRKIILLLAVICGGFIFGFDNAMAITFTAPNTQKNVSGHIWDEATYAVNINKTTLNPGENLTVTSEVVDAMNCSNEDSSSVYGLRTWFNTHSKLLSARSYPGGKHDDEIIAVYGAAICTHQQSMKGTCSFVGAVENTPGNYSVGARGYGHRETYNKNAVFDIAMGDACEPDGRCAWMDVALPYSVNDINPTATLAVSDNYVTFGETINVSWSSTNAVANGCEMTVKKPDNSFINTIPQTTSGSRTDGPPTYLNAAGTWTYSYRCRNSAGTWSVWDTEDVVVAYSCTGLIPAGSTMCADDDTGLTSELAWAYVGTSSASCTDAQKCEYYTPCTPNYDDYSCSYSGSCTDQTCGQPITRTATCTKTDTVCGEGTILAPGGLAECESNGVSCSDETITCPACARGFREVTP